MSNPGLLPHSIISTPLLEELEELERLAAEEERARDRQLQPAHAGAEEPPTDGGPPAGRGSDPGHWSAGSGDSIERVKLILRVAGDDQGAWKEIRAPLSHELERLGARFEWLAGRFVACELSAAQLLAFVEEDLQRSIHERLLGRIWPDFVVRPLLYRSIDAIGATTIDQDYQATGNGVIWAVIDSGIDSQHLHFQTYDTLGGSVAHLHRDFTPEQPDPDPAAALRDDFGHGTHVAGIIAGSLLPLGSRVSGPSAPAAEWFGVYGAERNKGISQTDDSDPTVGRATSDGPDLAERVGIDASRLRGVAPLCKLVSLKVMNADARAPDETDRTRNVLRALQYVLDVNAGGRVIHGVNLSLGYEFGPDWPECGRSPLCELVDQVVASGVVVVAAAGNTGYGYRRAKSSVTLGGLAVTINDPGNAERAITVGSTNALDPRGYGVSYFSSKGPTADGRTKPDLLAPGERVTSCATLPFLDGGPESVTDHPGSNYVESSGTSQAAPHVSGSIAAFLSVRPTYHWRPDDVKQVFVASALPLGRDHYFEGRGLVRVDAALASA